MRTWHRYETVYLLLAGLATPLVLSVHSIVSFDFATSILPGWHTTIFPPYFVAGAIFSGMSMVLTLMIIARKTMRSRVPHRNHIDAMTKIILVTSAWSAGLRHRVLHRLYSGNEYERFVFLNRALGPMAWSYWIMVSCNVLVPQLFWFRSCGGIWRWSSWLRSSSTSACGSSASSSSSRRCTGTSCPRAGRATLPTSIEMATLIGSFGLFFTCFLLFCRFFPVIAMAEIKGVLPRRPRGEEGEA